MTFDLENALNDPKMTSVLTGLGLPINLSMISDDKIDQCSTGDQSEFLRILTSNSVTLVKVKGHMTIVRYCGLDTSIIL